MKRAKNVWVLLLLVTTFMYSAINVSVVVAVEKVYTAGSVYADVETQTVASGNDAADDPAVWVHPTNPSESTIVATNKDGGILVYDLDGRELHSYKAGKPNNIDVRYNFPLGGEIIDIAGASDRVKNALIFYKIDPVSRGLIEIHARDIVSSMSEVYGFCLYHSLSTGKFYALVAGKKGELEQWELFDNGDQKIDARLVRYMEVGSQSEGLVADDELGCFYVGEEDVAIWKYGAEPEAGNVRTKVDDVMSGHLTADIEGLTLLYAAKGKGYLIASSQGNNSYAIYQRGGENEYEGSFVIADGNIDGTFDTDGIDVVGIGLGKKFPNGLFVAQDGLNMDGIFKRNQNFKLVAWDKIAKSIQPNLELDNQYNPRNLKQR